MTADFHQLEPDSGLVACCGLAQNRRLSLQTPVERTAGISQGRFHDLRHTAATLMPAMSGDPRTIMEAVGHSQISLTMNTYSHVLALPAALQAEAAPKMGTFSMR